MNRLLVLAMLWGCTLSAQARPAQRVRVTAPQPNVLLFVFDDLSWLNGNFGDPWDAFTPNIDAVAQQGVRFDSCYGGSSCQPARRMIQSGIWWCSDSGPAHQAPTAHTPLLSEVFISERVNSVGYVSALFAKWHLGGSRIAAWPHERAPNSQGYGYWFAGTEANINAWFGSTPPTQAPGYSHWWMTEGQQGGAWQGALCTTYQPDHLEARFAALYPLAPTPNLTVVNFNFPHEPQHSPPGCTPFAGPWQYECMIEYQDQALGYMLAQVNFNDTLVIICADNGTPPNIGGNRAKSTCYERGLRVPLIIAGAGVHPSRYGTTTNELVSLVDIPATVAAAAGAPFSGGPYPLAGRDLSPLLGVGQPWVPREHVISGNNWENQLEGTRCLVEVDPATQHRWKLIEWDGPAGAADGVADRWELYDLAVDPTEAADVAATNPTRVASMRATLEAEALP